MQEVYNNSKYIIVAGLKNDDGDNYFVINKMWNITEYSCKSLPQAIETANLYERYLLASDSGQEDLFEEYEKLNYENSPH